MTRLSPAPVIAGSLAQSALLLALLALPAPAQHENAPGQPETTPAPVVTSEAAPQPVVQSLRHVKRLCVEDFDGGENARQLRALLIAEFHRMGAFILTENPQKADAFLKGFGEDLIYTEQHSRDENLTTRGSGAVSTGGYTRNRASASQSVAGSTAVRERAELRRHEASLTIRIVNADGDVLWSKTAESRGGKFRSAGADVAGKLALALGESLKLPGEENSGQKP